MERRREGEKKDWVRRSDGKEEGEEREEKRNEEEENSRSGEIPRAVSSLQN